MNKKFKDYFYNISFEEIFKRIKQTYFLKKIDRKKEKVVDNLTSLYFKERQNRN